MGTHDVVAIGSDREERRFVRALLDEIDAVEDLVAAGAFEDGPPRIGAEQEMFLVDAHGRPARCALEVLERARDGRLTTEIGTYNLEANLTPRDLVGDALRAMQAENEQLLALVRSAGAPAGVAPLITGILPSLRMEDTGPDVLTPVDRYLLMAHAFRRLRGAPFEIVVRGADELLVRSESVSIESANASFQVHLQVAPRDFARAYNVAQLVTGPILAIAANSPILFGRRLWAETRIALFHASTDCRRTAIATRGAPPRVAFGDRWVEDGVVELWRDDALRYRPVLATRQGDHPPARDMVASGDVPELGALRLHNGTVYRWNRPCYGVLEGRPHLRIEARAFPAGPTVLDQMANAALFVGAVLGGVQAWGDVARRMPFEDASRNFAEAARAGIQADLAWLDGQTHPARRVVAQILPVARAGLLEVGVDVADVDRLLGVIERRVESGRNGARWTSEANARAMAEEQPVGDRMRALTLALLDRQGSPQAVAEWDVPRSLSVTAAVGPTPVAEVMSTDLVTVRPDDAVALARAVLRWRDVHHVPVEDADGIPLGILVAADLQGADDEEPVRSRIQRPPARVDVRAPLADAIQALRRTPERAVVVVADDRLAGVLTETDVIDWTARHG